MKHGVDDVMDESFFRTCWLVLKAGKPRLRHVMDKIELDVGGVTAAAAPVRTRKTEKKNDEHTAPVRV